MPMKDGDNPPTASELAARESGPRTTGIVCPKCGAAHLKANGTNPASTGTIYRYMVCRNPRCVDEITGKRTTFQYKQAPPEFVREITRRDDRAELSVYRETA
jgi:hypothetical protein